MTDDTKRILLPLAASKALAAFAERIGQDPQELAAEAIERFIAEEEPIVEKVLEGIEDIRQGRTFSHDEVMREMRQVIEDAARKRA